MRDGNANSVVMYVPEVEVWASGRDSGTYTRLYYATTYKQARSQAQCERALAAKYRIGTQFLPAYMRGVQHD